MSNTEELTKNKSHASLSGVVESFTEIDIPDLGVGRVTTTATMILTTLIDPFKNVKTDESGRTDKMMDELFTKFKDLIVRTNTVMNWIAHPKSNVERMRDGNPVPCHQTMLLGGASWDNSMDGCYSIFRPFSHINIRDTRVHFYNSKQRKQELTTQRGVHEGIDYDIKTSRYLFNGEDVISSFITV